jgi:uracil-DNA glycosylase
MEQYGLHLGRECLKTGIQQDTPLTALAFFLAAPQRWNTRKCSEKEVKIFQTSLEACPNLNPNRIVVHGCYLMNPASDRPEVRTKSAKMFVNELQVCDSLGVGRYVFHPGCFKGADTQIGLQCTVDLINRGLQESKNVQILVENMTQTNRLCQTWQEVDWVLSHVNDPRVGTCMDTAHCWGAGAQKGMFMETLLDDFERIVGIERLGAIHLNDSKVAYGSNVDRHEDIMKGKIPHSFWPSFILDERVRQIPAILETPTNCHPVVQQIIANSKAMGVLDKSMPAEAVVPPTTITGYFCKQSPPDHSKKIAANQKQVKRQLQSMFSYEPVQEEKKNPFSALKDTVPHDWRQVLAQEFEKPYFHKLARFLMQEYEEGKTIFPPVHKIFRAFEYCPLDQIKVVIIGQDPYHGPRQAEGMSFSVPEGVPVPSSLRNIYKELVTDIPGFTKPKHGHLKKWAQQGVFLLNAGLTVRMRQANSHAGQGWFQFTDAVVDYLNKKKEGLVFMLWGNFAKKKGAKIDTKKHCVLRSVHPSGLSASRGFFGCRHFSRCNNYLKQHGKQEINWQI